MSRHAVITMLLFAVPLGGCQRKTEVAEPDGVSGSSLFQNDPSQRLSPGR